MASAINISKLMSGKSPRQVMLEETRELRKKWDRTGLLHGLAETEQAQMSVLLENQSKQLLDEANATGTSAGSEEWSGVALPLVRRVFAEIAAKEFVSIQPMNLPSGLIFYLNFKFGTNQPGNPNYLGESLFGGTGATKYKSTNQAVNGLYGEGRYGYSVNESVVSVSGGNAVAATASWVEVGFDSELSASVAANEIVSITIPTGSLPELDLEAVRSFHISSSNFDAEDSYYPQFTKVVGSSVVFYAKLDNINSGSGTVEVAYSKQPVSFDRGDFEDRNPYAGSGVNTGLDNGSDLQIPEIDLELKSEPIVAKTRKLKAVWTPELAQDLNAYHSIDAEVELTQMLSEFISLEIDLEILDMLRSNALTTEYWSATINEEYDSATGTWFSTSAGTAYQKNTWFQTLGTKLNKVSNKIHQLTLRGGANFIVASPDVCTILESIPAFSVSAEKDTMQFAAGVTTVGSLANRYTVYKNPYMTSNEILLGFKGSNFLETGAVYAPYVPLIMTPLVYDPTNFTPRRGVMTRYAKKMVRPEFYGKIYVKDLASI
jgi:hypothetical protein